MPTTCSDASIVAVGHRGAGVNAFMETKETDKRGLEYERRKVMPEVAARVVSGCNTVCHAVCRGFRKQLQAGRHRAEG